MHYEYEPPTALPGAALACSILSAQALCMERLSAEVVDELGRYRHTRTQIADLITRLIDELDQIEAADEDLEDMDEGAGDACEDEGAADAEAEPSLGSLERGPSDQTWWAQGLGDDRENDPAEIDDDREANASEGAPEWRPSVPVKRIAGRARA